MRTLVVDDEFLARRRILRLLKGEADVEVVGECENGQEAVAAIHRTEPDLVFLDVQMPEIDGFGVLEAVGPANMPAVIFVTAYDQYALRAFDVHALDYLLKPFAPDRFAQALGRARAALGSHASPGDTGRRLAALLDELRGQGRWLDRLAVNEGGRVFFLRTDEIGWMESAGNYLKLHAAGAEHLVRGTLKGIEARLDPDRFVRIQRSVLVNLDHVREIQPWFQGEYVLILRDGTQLHSAGGHGKRIRALTRNPI